MLNASLVSAGSVWKRLAERKTSHPKDVVNLENRLLG